MAPFEDGKVSKRCQAARNHMGGRARRPRDDPWHHRCVGHAQARNAAHTQRWVDNSELIHAHLAGSHGMSKARCGKPGKLSDPLSRRLGAGNELGLVHTVKGMLIPEFAALAHSLATDTTEGDRCELKMARGRRPGRHRDLARGARVRTIRVGALGDAAFHRAWRAGRATSTDQIIPKAIGQRR